MKNFKRILGGGLVLLACFMAASCGGGDSSLASSSSSSGSSSGGGVTGSNVLPVIVDQGPDGTTNPAVNTLYATVTVCVPGTSTCQSVDHVQVDTGSYGLRVLATALTLSLPVSAASDGNSLAECTQFVDGYSWGPVAIADVKLAGELASNVPIQLIGASGFAAVPAACASTGPAEDTLAQFGANGVLGIGVFAQDCGPDCATSTGAQDYYSCSSTACVLVTVPLVNQVLNPVPLFATDNNGTIIELPTVAAAGAATLSGSLIFGIDTETNNVSNAKTVLGVQGTTGVSPGNFTTSFNGQALDQSFIDSGTNGLFFNDSSIPACTDPAVTGFYCPASELNLSATLTGVNNASVIIDFAIDNALTLVDDGPSFAVFPTLGGTYSGSATFDWGLPFFYGRNVASAIEGFSTTAGNGPYVAF